MYERIPFSKSNMLNLADKVQLFVSILEKEEVSYADSFNYIIGIVGNNYDYIFLEKLNSKEKIMFWIEKLKSRIVMNEDKAVIEDIIDDYILCG